MKCFLLSPPDPESIASAGLFSAWCGAPIQSFGRPAEDDDEGKLAESLDIMLSELYRGAQKRWYQFAGQGFLKAAQNRPVDWYRQLDEPLSRRRGWLLADPRLCHLAPHLIPHLRPDALLIAYPEPLACATALSATWRFPIAMGLALWEYYLISALGAGGELPTILVSLPRYHHDQTAFFADIEGQLARQGIDTPPGTPGKLPTPESPRLRSDNIEPRYFLSTHQQEFFAELENRELDAARERSVSEASRDLLTHYGDLRASLEVVKTERDALRAQLDAMLRAEEEAGAAAAVKVPDVDAVPEPQVGVSVQIEDMQPLAFTCTADAPILAVLQDVMHNQEAYRDKLIFLNYGPDAGDTLYFCGQSLQALELAPA